MPDFEIEAEAVVRSEDRVRLIERKCDACGRVSWTGVRCTACWHASLTNRPSPVPWVPPEDLGREGGVQTAELIPPEFVCGAGCDHDEPRPVTDLHASAIDLGWYAEIRHSRGAAMGGTGKQLAVADMWTVRFRRWGWQGYAARRGETWDSVCVTGADLPPFLGLGVTELKVWLAEPQQPRSWYLAVTARRAAQKLAAKVTPCPGAPACVLIGPGTPLDLPHEHRGSGAIKPKAVKREQVTAL